MNNRTHANGNGNVTVGVNSDGETRIFLNMDDEYVLNERYVVIFRTNSIEEAEKAEKHYRNKNTCFCVIEVSINGKRMYKLRKHVGVLTIAPIGTVGAFSRRRDAKKLLGELRGRDQETA